MSRLSIILCAALLCGFASYPSSPGLPAATADLKTSLDSLVTRLVADDSFSGVVFVARKGEVIYQRATGTANRERGIPMSVDSKLQIASATKLFTQIAIRQLEQQGKLSLTDTVGKFFPDYPNRTVRAKVNVEHLLRHRSGIGSFWNERFMSRRASIRSIRDYLELFQNDSLLFEPGTSEAYSNGGYVLLGAIIEHVSGESYHDYIRRHILVPAGMTETQPFDSRVAVANSAVGYTFQNLDGPMTGDRRLAGTGPRPGYEGTPASAGSPTPTIRRSAPGTSDSTTSSAGGLRLRIVGPDGRQLSPEEARQAVAQRAASGAIRRANTGFQAGMSSPAGDHYSTVGDFLKLARALTSHELLDSTRTAGVLGQRYATGGDFRANGGGPGVNAEFSIYPSGDVMVVLSNYDPPSATTIAQFIRSLLAPAAAAVNSLRTEIDSLHAAMVSAFKRDPPSVARFYTDDARIIGMGMHVTGREQVNQYWSQGMGASDWILETVDTGGTPDNPWVLGRSTIVGTGGRRMVTDYLAVLARGADGRLRYRIDLFTPAQSPTIRSQ